MCKNASNFIKQKLLFILQEKKIIIVCHRSLGSFLLTCLKQKKYFKVWFEPPTDQGNSET